MLFLHTSDWHLGRTDDDRSLLDDQRFFIDEICRVIREKGVGAVLLAGDVFDRSVASAEAVRLWDDAATRIAGEMGVPLFVIAGNHDGAERLSSCAALLEKAGFYVSGALTREPKAVLFPDAEVFLLPWVSLEKARAVYPEKAEEMKTLEDAYRVICDGLRSRFTPGKRHFAVAHAFVTGAETSKSDGAAEIGLAPQVPASVFAGFDYVALGHIHKPQDVGENARYSGTPMPYAFGKEEKQTKSVTLIDTETLSRDVVELPLLHRRITLTGSPEALLAGDWDEETRNAYLRICCPDDFVGAERQTALLSVFPNALEIYGKVFSDEGSVITLTGEQLDEIVSSPEEVFRWFCRDELKLDPDARQTALFMNAVKETEEDV